jgi:molybdopterin-guanine dinucleotide biosynthesis protein A
METIDGEPLVHRAIRALDTVCGEVIVSTGEEPPQLPQDLTLVLVQDRVKGQGPLAGLAAALAEVESDLAVVIGGDMPDVSPAVLELMIAALEEDDDIEIVALRDGDKIRPLPCVLKTSSATVKIGALFDSGERRLRAMLSELRLASVPETIWRTLDPAGGSLRDIDSPEDLVL